MAMNLLGLGLHDAGRREDALTVQEAELSMQRRIGASEHNVLITQSNLANTYHDLGRNEEALQMRRDAYSGCLKLHGEEHVETLLAANNYAEGLHSVQRFEEAKSLLRRQIPVARRFLGESNELILRMPWVYADALYKDPSASLDDLCEAVTTLEETAPIARRVFGAAHPLTGGIERTLRAAQAALRARETPPPGS